MVDLGTSDDVVLLVATVFALTVFAAGAVERRRHRRRLTGIPLRISVNGSRGKSTVTRLLTGALTAGGWRSLGKTTGSAAQLIRGWDAVAEDVRRRPEGPNIGEQRGLVRRAVADGVDALVTECMAVTPEYQRTFHRELLDANLLVITNALADHLEEMGPTVADVAEVLADSVPRDGVVVLAPGDHLATFERVAWQRGCTVVHADVEAVADDEVAGFDHLVLPEHVAQVLAVTRHLGIADDEALAGMRSAPPDPYATRLLDVGDPWQPALFVNAFPANDPTSTLAVWEHVRARGVRPDGLVVVMNCRDDRIARTRQFANEVLPRLPIATLVVTGRGTRSVLRAVDTGVLAVDDVRDHTGDDADTVIEALRPLLADRVVLGVGNLHGGGAELVAGFDALAVAEHASSEAP